MKRYYAVSYKHSATSFSGYVEKVRYFGSEAEALVFYLLPGEREYANDPGSEQRDKRLLATTGWKQILPVSDDKEETSP